MNGKPEILAGILTAVFFCGTSVHAEDMDTIGSLTETTAKISAIDMNKDFEDAGQLLDSFYTGGLTKTERESCVVYAAPASAEETTATSADIYTAAPSKVIIPGKVPPMPSDPVREQSGNGQLPIRAAGMVAGTLALGLAVRKTGPFNGYFDNYEEDLHTVADAIQNPIETISDLWNYGSGGDQLPIPNPPANPDPGNTHYDVHNDAGVAVHHNPWTGTSTQ